MQRGSAADQALAGFKNGLSYPAAVKHKSTIRGHVKIGTGKHDIDGTVLSVESAILEAPENVIGQPEDMLAGPQPRRRTYCMWLQPIVGKDGVSQNYLFNWSNTRIEETQWLDPQTGMGIFDQKPKIDPREKAHAASVFNAGMKLQFEKLTSSAGDLFVLVQSKVSGGNFEHRVGRYGKGLDQTQGNQAMFKIQELWDMTKALVIPTTDAEGTRSAKSRTTDLTAGSHFEDDSCKICGENINKIFDDAVRCGIKHQSEDWFCTVMGPIGTVELPASARAEAGGAAGSSGSAQDMSDNQVPIMHVDSGSSELFYYDSRGKRSPVRELIANAYLPPTCDIAIQEEAAIQTLDVWVQGKQVDFEQSLWNQLGEGSEVFDVSEVVCRVQKERQEANMEDDDMVGEDIVAYLQHRRIPDMRENHGILVAAKSSARFLNHDDPMAFYKDELGREHFCIDGTLQLLFDRMKADGTIKGKIALQYEDLVCFMDHAPVFREEEWKAFYDRCVKLPDGFERVCRAIGMGSLAIVLLTKPLQMDFNKSKLVTQPSETPGLPLPLDAMGAIYRKLVESLFSHERDFLPPPPPRRPLRPSKKRPAEAAALVPRSADPDGGSAGSRAARGSAQPLRLGINDPNAATEQGGAKKSKTSAEKLKSTKAVKRLKERHATALPDIVRELISAAESGGTIPAALLKKLKKSQEDIVSDINML